MVWYMSKILDRVNNPQDLKQLKSAELKQLASEIREELVSVVSTNGGHLASNLGVVELTLAIHRVFDSPKDKIVWDVGHQVYTHKLVTGRKDKFSTLRQYKGISGFTSRNESEHDAFGAGHASTSVSAALGMAIARDLNGEDYNVVAVIGDGAITGGMALEALNQAGITGSRLIVILNDNGMSISPTVGALARLMDRVRMDYRTRKAKEKSRSLISALPMGKKLWKVGERFETGVKGLVMSTAMWEDLGFTHVGPVDGHNINELEVALKQAKEYHVKPVLLHIITTKGKGYLPAEGDAVYFHGVSAKTNTINKIPTYSEVFAQTILELARKEPKLVVITPAMPEGNCLSIVEKEFPEKVFDVGICEQHAVTFAAGLATQGQIPVVAIYSTFLQRAFDQIIHDVCLQDIPVTFAIDRGGIVGDDGVTHQGAFDISYLSLIPNMIVAVPKDENELRHMLYTSTKTKHPMAVRYPRRSGFGVELDPEYKMLEIGKAEVLRQGDDVVLLALGTMVYRTMTVADALAKKGIEATVVNARFAKPLDSALIIELAGNIKRIVTIEENVLSGGFGSNVAKLLQEAGKHDVRIVNIGLPDEFIEHGDQETLHSKLRLDTTGITQQVMELFPARKEAKAI